MTFYKLIRQIDITNKMIIKILLFVALMSIQSQAYYTTNGQDIVDRTTGEIVQLRGIGLGGWLLPEGYMWGIRVLDRPRQFEAAIEDLIGEADARKFWTLYHKNFFTRDDVAIMKSWGVNTLRIPLLASMLQPRKNQPTDPPFKYDETNFKYLNNLVDWCEELEMGIIWDLHGAPGGQNGANISDSDGEARLWTEKEYYWPLTIDLWDQITKRYADYNCIVGYDLLNEPLLGRYPGVEVGLLRELYIKLTQVIRETDSQGIIFVEGNDWAQNFSILEPLDWDPHLVLAFHSYPPSNTQSGIQRWDDLRIKYNLPLWHGETGEQDPPWELYKRSTIFLEQSNIGWNWWTHKKFELYRQPWSIQRTPGFVKILDYWKGKGKKPSRRQARRWLFKQARMTNTNNCEFLPGMVESLHPLDPAQYLLIQGIKKPAIIKQPQSQTIETGYSSVITVQARGYPLQYQWYRDGKPIPGATSFQLYLHQMPEIKRTGDYYVTVSNEEGIIQSNKTRIMQNPFNGHVIENTSSSPIIDGLVDDLWQSKRKINLTNVVVGDRDSQTDLGAWYSITWDDNNLYFFVRVFDDIISTNASIDYLKDGIEIYLDADNSKSTFYGDDEFQLRCVVDNNIITSAIGSIGDSASYSQTILADGYQMEISIPWESISTTGKPDHFLGLDVHINDNDGNTRNGKLSWWAKRDNSYQTPSVFGTVKLQKLR